MLTLPPRRSSLSSSGGEVERCVLGFGKHATVVGPEELKQRLFATTEELWQRYGGTEGKS